MVMRQHGPEAAQGKCRQIDAELRQVTLQVGTNERLAPLSAGGEIAGQEGTREAAAQPTDVKPVWLDAMLPICGSKFVESKTIKLLKGNAARQTLGGLSQELRCSATKNQEACRSIGAVGQHPQ